MDFATIGGLLFAAFAVMGAFTLDGGRAESIFLFAPILLVVGGSLGVAALGSSGGVVRAMPSYFRIALFGRSAHRRPIADTIVRMAERARREGILALEKELVSADNKFLTTATLLVIDGVDMHTLRDAMANEISCLSGRHQRGIDFFTRLGGYSPTLGILGTVLALVHTLGQVENPERIAGAIASAFIATLWGVGMANLVWLPLADKLRTRHDDEVETLEMIAEGVIAIQSGDNPRLVRTRLDPYVNSTRRRAA